MRNLGRGQRGGVQAGEGFSGEGFRPAQRLREMFPAYLQGRGWIVLACVVVGAGSTGFLDCRAVALTSAQRADPWRAPPWLRGGSLRPDHESDFPASKPGFNSPRLSGDKVQNSIKCFILVLSFSLSNIPDSVIRPKTPGWNATLGARPDHHSFRRMLGVAVDRWDHQRQISRWRADGYQRV